MIKLVENKDDLDATVKTASFSLVIPTWREFEGLSRTIGNILMCSRAEIEREIIVIGDGYEPEVENIINAMNTKAKDLKQNVTFMYKYLADHVGNGDIPRQHGINEATKDWVIFIDAGTSVTQQMFEMLCEAITVCPDAKLICWDMVQMLDPVPFVSSCRLVIGTDHSRGLPYVIPGCAAALRREIAQSIPWEHVPHTASDWMYFSRVWDKLFMVDGVEDKEKVETQLALLPYVLTVAYGAREQRKFRPPLSVQNFNELKYYGSYENSLKEKYAHAGQQIGSVSESPGPLSTAL